MASSAAWRSAWSAGRRLSWSARSVERLPELTRSYAGQPVFCTVEEFDLWMADSDTVLVLNPNLA